MCDGIEALGFYYDKITVPVIIHRDGYADSESTANVYRMTQNRVDEEIKQNYSHQDNAYVRQCAQSDLMHYELRGQLSV